MQIRPLGKTGLQVSALGLGAAEIGFQGVPDQTVEALLGAALDAGLNVIDTAECYKDSEEKLGRALGARRKQCFLFTKCGHAPAPAPASLPVRACRRLMRPLARKLGFWLPDWDPRLLQRSIDRSLQRLKTDWIDLIQLHSCSEQMLRCGEVIEVLKRARQAGKTRFIGYSGDGAAAKYAVECGQFDTLQTSLNIADQEAIETTAPLARKSGMGVIVKRPIANALWRNRQRPENSYHHVYWDRLQRLNYDFLREPERALDTALRFPLAVDGVHTLIVGTTRPENWLKNAGYVAAGGLEPDKFQAIRARWQAIASADWVGQD